MSTPFSVSVQLNLPGDTGLEADPITFTYAGSYDERVNYELSLTGAGTQSVGLGTIDSPGVKLYLVRLNPEATAPINVRLNGGGSSGQQEIPPGGVGLLIAPVPVAGVTEIDIVHTAAGKVKIWALA